ncbi:MAG: hypothetical protein M1820_010345 [Bogoriella megaspora]|nr:MAG: hypothetical protein M1820_010345 [Bogoriella megaspora]
MLSGSSNARGSTKSSSEDASLDTALNTPALRTELALLIALSTDSMRRDLTTQFDYGHSRDSAPATENNLIDFDPPSRKSDKAQAHSVMDENDFELQALRRTALTSFDKWQISVLRRVGEVLNVRSEAVRKGRAAARQKAEAKVRADSDEAYLDWANGEDAVRAAKGPKTESCSESFGYYEPLDTLLARFAEDKRILILDSVLLLLLSLEQYTAYSRVLLQRLTTSLQLAPGVLSIQESKASETLLATAAASMSSDESTKRAAASNEASRRWKVGLATFAGAAVIGITGGLAAPLLAAGAGAIMGGLGLGAIASLLGPLATNMVLVGGLFGAYGGRMTGNLMDKYEKEVDDFKFIPVRRPKTADNAGNEAPENLGYHTIQDKTQQKQHKLRVTIGISGYLNKPSEVIAPWRVLNAETLEPFALRYELDVLLRLGESLISVLRAYAWDFAKFRLLTLVVAGLWPLGLLRMANVLDNPFAIAKARADKAGRVLADALIHKAQGERPVTLIGYSIGARVIFACLKELAEQNAFGLVESVVMMGAPTGTNHVQWRKARAVVSGKMVNVFSQEDYMLAFMHRASSGQIQVAGLQPVNNVSNVLNVDVTELVKGHTRYRHLIGEILRKIGFEDLDDRMVDKQLDNLKKIEKQEEEIRNEQKAKDGSDVEEKSTDADKLEPITMIDNEEAADQLKGANELKEQQYSKVLTSTQFTPDRLHEARPSRTVFPTAHRAEEQDNDDDYEISDSESQDVVGAQRQEMVMLAPEAEPDTGPDVETVRFGSSNSGFDVKWQND